VTLSIHPCPTVIVPKGAEFLAAKTAKTVPVIDDKLIIDIHNGLLRE
jgi:hypothetical protein